MLDYEIGAVDLQGEPPLVSVLVLTYNHERYIREALASVLSQKVPFSFEILIGEDCSTDETRRICIDIQASYPQLVRIITADDNVGILKNWHRLLRVSRGRFLAHLDGDDYWFAGKLDAQISVLQRRPEISAVYTNAIVVNEIGAKLGCFNNVGEQTFDLSALLRRGNFLNTSSMVFRTEYARSLLEISELFIDYRAHLRLARHGDVTQIAEPLAAYRTNVAGSMTSTSKDLIRQLYWDSIMDVPRDLVSENDMAAGIADFMRRVLSRTIRERRWSLIAHWAPRVYKASPYGWLATSALVALSSLRATLLAVSSRAREILSPHSSRVFHRR